MNDCPYCNGNGEVENFHHLSDQNQDGLKKELVICPYCNGNGAIESVNV